MNLIHKGAVLAAFAGGIILSAGGVASADSGAGAAAIGSPGVLSGNVVQAPVDIPLNACGNSLSVIGLLNPSFGNTCANIGGRGGSQTGGYQGEQGHESGGEHSAPVHREMTTHHMKSEEHCD